MNIYIYMCVCVCERAARLKEVACLCVWNIRKIKNESFKTEKKKKNTHTHTNSNMARIKFYLLFEQEIFWKMKKNFFFQFCRNQTEENRIIVFNFSGFRSISSIKSYTFNWSWFDFSSSSSSQWNNHKVGDSLHWKFSFAIFPLLYCKNAVIASSPPLILTKCILK